MPSHTVASDDAGRRLDRVLRRALPNVPPGAIAGAIRRGQVRVNGRRATSDTRLEPGDRIITPEWRDTGPAAGEVDRSMRPRPGGPRVDGPRRDDRNRPGRAQRDGERHRGPRDRHSRDHNRGERPPRDARDRMRRERPDGARDSRMRAPVPAPLVIIDRGRGWLAINKPAGVSSHGPGALDEAVRNRAAREGWWVESLSFRPGPVHRLDRGTSGVELFSLSLLGAQSIAAAFAERRTCKLYLALAGGRIAARTTCREPLGYDNATRRAYTRATLPAPGAPLEEAHTEFRPIAVSADETVTLVAALPATGRTHQIRAHLAALGHPLLGDTRYGAAADGDPDGYLLHALALYVPADAARRSDDAVDLPIACIAELPTREFARVRRRFGDAAPLERRLRELLAEVCPDAARRTTLKL